MAVSCVRGSESAQPRCNDISIHLGLLASKELSGTSFMDRNAGKCLGVKECSLNGIRWGGSSIIGVEWPKLVYWRECQSRRMLRGLR